MRRPFQVGRNKSPLRRRRSPGSPVEAKIYALTDALRGIADETARCAANSEGGRVPHERRPANLIKIGIARLIDVLIYDRELWVLERWVDEYCPHRRRSPTVSQQPYLAALLALNWFYPLSAVDRRVFGYQLHLARQHDVPARLVPGFIWQIGTAASRPPLGMPYWTDSNYDPDDEDWGTMTARSPWVLRSSNVKTAKCQGRR